MVEREGIIEVVNVCCECGNTYPTCYEPTMGRGFQLIHIGCGGVVDQLRRENLPESFPCLPQSLKSQVHNERMVK